MDDTKLKYCRFCAEQKNGEELLDLNDYSYIYKELEEKLALFSVKCVDLSPHNNLPKTICFVCNTSLNNAYEFFNKVQHSQNVLGAVFYDETNVKHEVPIDSHYYDESKANVKAEFGSGTNHLDDPESELSSLENEVEVPIAEDDAELVVTYSGIPMFEKDAKVATPWESSVCKDPSWSSYPWLCKFCQVCTQFGTLQPAFTDINLLREHSENVHDLCCAFKCTDCSEQFDDFESFVEHARNHRTALR